MSNDIFDDIFSNRKIYVREFGSGFPAVGQNSVIYIDTNVNAIYRWTGSAYEEIGQYPQVETYANLPAAADNTGKIYFVKNSSGIWPLNKPAGFYFSNGTTWQQEPMTAGALTSADVINNLTSTNTNKPLSANQGYVLKGLIDTIATETTLEVAYDNSITNPKIQTTPTGGALTLRGYSGGDAANVLEVQDFAGTTNLSITGNGLLTVGAGVSSTINLNGSTNYSLQSTTGNDFYIKDEAAGENRFAIENGDFILTGAGVGSALTLTDTLQIESQISPSTFTALSALSLSSDSDLILNPKGYGGVFFNSSGGGGVGFLDGAGNQYASIVNAGAGKCFFSVTGTINQYGTASNNHLEGKTKFGSTSTPAEVIDVAGNILASGSITGGSITSNGHLSVIYSGDAYLNIEGSAAAFLRFKDSGASVNSKFFTLINDNQNFYFRQLNDDGTNKGDAVFIQGSTRYVGIGKTNPAALLDVAGGIISDGGIYAGTTLGAGGNLNVFGGGFFGENSSVSKSTTSANQPYFLVENTGVTVGADHDASLIALAKQTGESSFYLSNYTDPNYATWGIIKGGSDNHLYFQYGAYDPINNSGSLSTKMLLTNDGKVSIGLGVPTERMEVITGLCARYNTASDANRIGFNSAAGGATDYLRVSIWGQGKAVIRYDLIKWDSWNGGGGVGDFNLVRHYTQTNVAMRLQDQKAKFGADSAPIETIDATGNIIATGYIRGDAAGQVLNISIVNFSGADQTITSPFTNYITIATTNYTPVSANSYLIIEFFAAYKINGGSTDSFLSRLTSGGTDIAFSQQIFGSSSGTGTRGGTLFPLMGFYTNSSTAAKTITASAKQISSDDSMIIYKSFIGGVNMKITEIAR